MRMDPLQQGGSRGQLPARDALGDDEFQAGAGDHRPQDADPQQVAGEGPGGEIPRADAGGCDQQTGADDGEQAGKRFH